MQSYLTCTGIKNLIIDDKMYFDSVFLVYYIYWNIPLTHEYGTNSVNVYSVSLSGVLAYVFIN